MRSLQMCRNQFAMTGKVLHQRRMHHVPSIVCNYGMISCNCKERTFSFSYGIVARHRIKILYLMYIITRNLLSSTSADLILGILLRQDFQYFVQLTLHVFQFTFQLIYSRTQSNDVVRNLIFLLLMQKRPSSFLV